MSRSTLALLCIALLAIGFAAGWREKGVHVDAGQVQEVRDQAQQITRWVHRQAASLQQHLQLEQAASLELLIAQRAVRDAGTAIRLEIRHAMFTVPSPGCPGPLDSTEFYRLYNAAAAGGDPAPAGAAVPGRVHPPGL